MLVFEDVLGLVTAVWVGFLCWLPFQFLPVWAAAFIDVVLLAAAVMGLACAKASGMASRVEEQDLERSEY